MGILTFHLLGLGFYLMSALASYSNESIIGLYATSTTTSSLKGPSWAGVLKTGGMGVIEAGSDLLSALVTEIPTGAAISLNNFA